MIKLAKLLIFISAMLNSALMTAEVVYKDSKARFSLVSDGVIRMEYAPDGKFVDDATLVAVNRNYPKIKSTVTDDNGWVVITTDQMEVRYKKKSGKFTPANLSITSKRNDVDFTWHPGDRQKHNLKGTYRTLDRCDGDTIRNYNGKNTTVPLEDGLLARDGWTLVDDSGNFRFNGDKDWDWVDYSKSKKGAQDWYFMTYGTDFKKALKDYTLFAGNMPLPPRYTFGFWWSRYWSYSDRELRELIKNFKDSDIPMDVLVIDMDWHYTEPGKGGWTGYTWNRDLFPNPQGILDHVKDNNLKITMNLHPASGVYDYEEKFPEMRKALALKDTVTHIDHVSGDKKYINAWMDNILHPLQDQGVDFWWLDWQQYPTDKKFKGLSNTWWLNYVFFTDMERHGENRPLLYHRWGGLGNHRYQIGFSGDTHITWNSLDYQPYFNSTASNVLYGYWSHDIGGHYRGIGRIDPEMYVRWLQFGALSPVLRVHSTKNASLRKEPWSFDGETKGIIKDIINMRYAMSPYIYSNAREACETAVSLCRPMYYDYPTAEDAYKFRNEYMFGDNMLVMPVTNPMVGDYSEVEVWLPEGNDWYEVSTGTLLPGGQTVKRHFAIDEYPLYIKGGSVIPMAPGQKTLRSNDYAYELNIYPGGDGSFNIYEDNGNDKNYRNEFASTSVKSVQKGNKIKIEISPREGSYKEMPSKRDMAVRIHGRGVPSSIKVNGKKIDGKYDGETLTTLVAMSDNPELPQTLEVEYPDDSLVADGTLGKFNRIYKGTQMLKNNDAWKLYNDAVASLETTPAKINYNPQDFSEIMKDFNEGYSRLPELLMHLLNDKQKQDETNLKRKSDFLKIINWE